MADKDLARTLRQFMVVYEMPNEYIDSFIAGSITELDIQKKATAFIDFIKNHRTEFASDLQDALVNIDGVLVNNKYDLSACGLTLLKKTATEELSVIHQFAKTSNFDAGKAVTNLLRLIKAGERGAVR